MKLNPPLKPRNYYTLDPTVETKVMCFVHEANELKPVLEPN